jgi:uncharacterized protein
MSPTESAAESRPALCVSIHDVAPATWPQCARLLQMIRAVADIPVTLLVVPDYHGLAVPRPAEYDRQLEQCLAHGDELVLHGYRHLDEAAPPASLRDRFIRQTYTRSEGEFFAITEAEARRRIRLGLEWFAQRRFPVEGFVAPAWLLGDDAWQALAGFPFRYTTTLRHFYLLPSGKPQGERLASRSMVYSVGAGWRRQMSRGWNALLCRALAGNPLARLSLHPVDAQYPHVMRQCQTLLETLLEYRAPMTKAAFARRWQARQGQALMDDFSAGAGSTAP